MQELYATIARLPEDFRLALVAVDVLGLSYREAARALKVREGTITTRLFRARRQVARALDPELATVQAPSIASDADARAGDDARVASAGAGAKAPVSHAEGARAEQTERIEHSREESRASGVLPSGGTT